MYSLLIPMKMLHSTRPYTLSTQKYIQERKKNHIRNRTIIFQCTPDGLQPLGKWKGELLLIKMTGSTHSIKLSNEFSPFLKRNFLNKNIRCTLMCSVSFRIKYSLRKMKFTCSCDYGCFVAAIGMYTCSCSGREKSENRNDMENGSRNGSMYTLLSM